MVIAVVNNKGGVGKTATSVNLSAALAGLGRRILLVDLDSQASASLWFGVTRGDLKPSSATCLLDGYPVTRAIRQTAVPNLDLLTGSVELASADVALCDVRGRELALKKVLAGMRDHYDVILIDCPPSLSLLCVNALVAADGVIVPVTSQHLAAEGLASLLGAIEKVRTGLGSRPRLLGILLTMVNGPREGATEIRERLRAQYRDKVFHTEIPDARALEDAPAAGRDIFRFRPKSKAADAYRRLAGELLERLRTTRH